MPAGAASPRHLDGWLVATAGSAVVLTGTAFYWAFFDQGAGSAEQLFLQAFVVVPVLLGVVACILHARRWLAWLVPTVTFLAAVPAVLVAWVEPPPNPGDEACSARGFLPQVVEDWFEAFSELLFPGSLIVIAAGGLLLIWPRTRILAPWMLAAGLTQMGAAFTSWTCIGG